MKISQARSYKEGKAIYKWWRCFTECYHMVPNGNKRNGNFKSTEGMHNKLFHSSLVGVQLLSINLTNSYNVAPILMIINAKEAKTNNDLMYAPFVQLVYPWEISTHLFHCPKALNSCCKIWIYYHMSPGLTGVTPNALSIILLKPDDCIGQQITGKYFVVSVCTRQWQRHHPSTVALPEIHNPCFNYFEDLVGRKDLLLSFICHCRCDSRSRDASNYPQIGQSWLECYQCSITVWETSGRSIVHPDRYNLSPPLGIIIKKRYFQ